MAIKDNKRGVLKRRENANLFQMAKGLAPKETPNTQQLVSRRNNAATELNLWRSLLETAYYYALPNYNPWINMGRGGAITPGQQQNAGVFDLTLPIAHTKLCNKMLVGMIPQGQQWVKFVPGDAFGQNNKQAKEATQRFTDLFFDIIDGSNFYLASSEALSDCLISTGVLTCNEGTKKKPLRFESVPVSQVMFEGDPLGGISAVFRDWIDIRVEHISMMWPDARLPNNKKSSDKVSLYECSYIDYKAEDSKRYKYLVMTTGEEVLLESASSSWAWIIFRMRKLTGETRGRGPTLEAVPTAATINEAVGDELMSAAFTANPMLMAASDSAINNETFRAKPGAIIPVQMVMGEWPVQQFPGGGNIQFSAMVISDFRQQINELLYSAPLGPLTAPDKTATESQIRYMENLESFSAMVPRLQAEFFDPVISRALWVINKVSPEVFGDIDPSIREQMLSLDGQILDLKYETPLMTARGQVKTQALLGFYQALASMIGPEAATASLKPAQLVQTIADNSGADLSVIQSEEEIQQTIQQASEIAQNQIEQEEMPDV